MYIVLKNSLGVEIQRQQVFHNDILYRALRRFVEDNYITAGYSILIIKETNQPDSESANLQQLLNIVKLKIKKD